MPRFEATSTPLSASATFTSGVLTTDLYDSAVGTVYADQAGTAYVDQSLDGINFDASTTIAVTASTGATINVPLVAPYFRLRYVNSASPQTVFRAAIKATASGTR